MLQEREISHRSKVFAGANIPYQWVATKEIIGYYRMRETFNLLCFECFFLRNNKLMGAFCSCVATYIIDLLTRAYSRFVTGLPCLCSTSEKASLFFRFYRSVPVHLFAGRRA